MHLYFIKILSKVDQNLLYVRLSQKLRQAHASFIPAYANGIPSLQLHLNLSRTMQTATRHPKCICISSKVDYNLLHVRLSQKFWKVHASFIPAHGNGIHHFQLHLNHSRLYRHPRASQCIYISSKVDQNLPVRLSQKSQQAHANFIPAHASFIPAHAIFNLAHAIFNPAHAIFNPAHANGIPPLSDAPEPLQNYVDSLEASLMHLYFIKD